MTKTWIPRDYQRAQIAFNLQHARANNWAGTGTGKTGVGLETFCMRRLFGEVSHLLVISTKRVAQHVWTTEAAKWANFADLKIAVAVGNVVERMEAIYSDADIVTINYENIPWLIDTIGDAWPWDMVIADESTRLKNLRIDPRTSSKGKEFLRKSGGGQRAAALAKIAHGKVRYWINLTGTPAPNGLIDLWGQAWYVDAGARLGRSYSAFADRWFRSVLVGTDAFARRLEPLAHADREIKEALADCTITIEAKDYFDLPPLVRNVISVRLPAKAYAHYREMEKEMFTLVERNEIEAFNAGAKSMKLRQIIAGAAYTDDTGAYAVVHDEKIDALRDVVDDLAGSPLIVCYQFKSDLARLQKAFPQGRYFDDKARTLADFKRGEIPILFLHPASAAHGIDGMQDSCHNIFFFSLTWNLEEFEQVIERIGPTRQAQAGHGRAVFVHVPLAADTIDEDMLDRLDTKASVQDALKAAMKKRGIC